MDSKYQGKRRDERMGLLIMLPTMCASGGVMRRQMVVLLPLLLLLFISSPCGNGFFLSLPRLGYPGFITQHMPPVLSSTMINTNVGISSPPSTTTTTTTTSSSTTTAPAPTTRSEAPIDDDPYGIVSAPTIELEVRSDEHTYCTSRVHLVIMASRGQRIPITTLIKSPQNCIIPPPKPFLPLSLYVMILFHTRSPPPL